MDVVDNCVRMCTKFIVNISLSEENMSNSYFSSLSLSAFSSLFTLSPLSLSLSSLLFSSLFSL